MQVLLIGGQIFQFNNGYHDNPHVGRPELLKKPVTKEQKVPGVFDIYLAGGGNAWVPPPSGTPMILWVVEGTGRRRSSFAHAFYP